MNKSIVFLFIIFIAMQVDGGHLSAPSGNLKATSLTSKIISSMDMAHISSKTNIKNIGDYYTFFFLDY